MKKYLLSAIFFFSVLAGFSQKINGQWHGYFNSNGDIGLYSSDNTEYVLELEITGTKVEGFSYSYFNGRRYYVICKLEGTYYPSSKSIKVIETERIKGNTPPDFSDCLQIHYLTYEKNGKEEEQLQGRWITKPGQPGTGCGNGNTTLVRRTLSKSLSKFNKQSTEQQPLAKKPAPKKDNTKDNTIAKTTPKSKQVKPANPPAVVKTTPPVKPSLPVAKSKDKPLQKTTTPAANPVTKVTPEVVAKEPSNIDKPETKKVEIAAVKSDMSFERRKADVLKTIQIENENFRVDLYDNGEVDGDSISVFYNNKLILSHKRLSEKPITLTLSIPDNDDINELTMYAENLGEIPPNTALMVVTDGDKRYEVRISSDLKNSGTIRFVHKPKNPQ